MLTSRYYVVVDWKHDFDSEPIKFFSELNEDRYEIRKIEMYRDGTFRYADKEHEVGDTFLSPVQFPSIEEISLEPECTASSISADLFEEVWQRAVASGK